MDGIHCTPHALLHARAHARTNLHPSLGVACLPSLSRAQTSAPSFVRQAGLHSEPPHRAAPFPPLSVHLPPQPGAPAGYACQRALGGLAGINRGGQAGRHVPVFSAFKHHYWIFSTYTPYRALPGHYSCIHAWPQPWAVSTHTAFSPSPSLSILGHCTPPRLSQDTFWTQTPAQKFREGHSHYFSHISPLFLFLYLVPLCLLDDNVVVRFLTTHLSLLASLSPFLSPKKKTSRPW